jgi:hypothetical protein
VNTPGAFSWFLEVANAAYLSAMSAAPVDVPADDSAHLDLCAGRVTVPWAGGRR